MIGIDIEFYDIEFLDGYFSGTLFLFDRDQRIILDFGYDVEFKILTLQNCKKPCIIHFLNTTHRKKSLIFGANMMHI